jgi:hypothetical protein
MRSFFERRLRSEVNVQELEKENGIELLVKFSERIWNDAYELTTEKDFGVESNVDTVIFVDEISALLNLELGEKNMVRVLRKVVSTRETLGNVFILFMDTLSKMFHVEKPTYFEIPSLRAVKNNWEAHSDVLPFTYVQPVDLLVDRVRLAFSSDFQAQNFLLRKNGGWTRGEQIVLFSMGRPLWASCALVEKDVNALLKLGQAKLLGVLLSDSSLEVFANQAQDKKSPSGGELSSVALIGSIAAINVTPSSELAHQLVSRRMGTVLAVHKSRGSMIVEYVSEPILAECSLTILTNSMRNWGLALEKFIKFVSFGMTNVGEAGELSLRIYLLLVRALLAKKENSFFFSESVSLSLFLKELLAGHEFPISSFLDQWLVNFTHFIKLHTKLSRSMVLQLWERGAAAVLRSGSAFADLVIPCLKRGDDGKLHHAVFMIQVKNYESKTVIHEEQVRNSSIPKKAMDSANPKLISKAIPQNVRRLLYLHFDVGINLKWYGGFCAGEELKIPEPNTKDELDDDSFDDEDLCGEENCDESPRLKVECMFKKERDSFIADILDTPTDVPEITPFTWNKLLQVQDLSDHFRERRFPMIFARNLYGYCSSLLARHNVSRNDALLILDCLVYLSGTVSTALYRIHGVDSRDAMQNMVPIAYDGREHDQHNGKRARYDE